jgi:pyrimidine operon attenuation protein/uracil phosphoribosyltransferase
MQTLLNGGQIQTLLAAIADEIAADSSLQLTGPTPVALVGIRSRGELLAARLAAILASRSKHPIDVGALDITMYRDDRASRRAITIPQGTDMNFRLDDRPVVLVDDVLETGGSVRAALDALVDFGRPKLIRLAVLIDRGGREFPIAANYVGTELTQMPNRKVRLRLKPNDAEDVAWLE